ncbi:MAG: hypothetical protein RIS94_2372, partial [Pseudomonadota bacterium]
QERRLEFHRWTLHSALQSSDPSVQDWVNSQAASFGGGPEGLAAAIRSIDLSVTRDAMVMAFSDDFLMLMIGIFAVIPLVLILRPLPKGHHQMAMH